MIENELNIIQISTDQMEIHRGLIKKQKSKKNIALLLTLLLLLTSRESILVLDKGVLLRSFYIHLIFFLSVNHLQFLAYRN